MEIIVGIMLVVILFVVLRAMYENTHYEIEYKDIMDDRVKDEFKVVFFADLHNTEYGKNNEKLIKDIEKFKPDIILIAGDLFVSKEKEKNEKAKRFLKEICKNNKVIYTFGNHETKLRNGEKYQYTIDCLDNMDFGGNLTILNNSQMKIVVNDNKINVIGYEADLKFYKKFKGFRPEYEDIISAVGKCEKSENEINFMLAHNPDYFESYAKYGTDYAFSGHNHGGIVRIPFVGGVLSTGFKPFPKYYGGEYKMYNTKMFVTRGLGSHTIRFRLFNLPQIHMYTFKNK